MHLSYLALLFATLLMISFDQTPFLLFDYSIALYVSTSYLFTRKKEVTSVKRGAKSTAKENILLGIANNRAAKEILAAFNEKREEKRTRRKGSKKKRKNRTSNHEN